MAQPLPNPPEETMPELSPVSLLASRLFDDSHYYHELDETSRCVLQQAAELHDLTLPTKSKNPIKTARSFVRDHVTGELSNDQIETLAALLAYQQGLIRRKELDKMDLSPAQQREVLTLAALLGLAIGLDASGSGETTMESFAAHGNGLWLVIQGPHAAMDAAAARHAARLWEKIGYPPIEVLESAEAAIRLAPLPEPSEKIGIEPDENLAEAARKVMRFHFARMLAREPGTRSGEDIEALHEMRVATRRMRAAFEVFEQAFEPGVLKPYLKGLRQAGRMLGRVRDLDVMIDNARAYAAGLPEGHPGLAPLLEEWSTQRDAARIEMLAYLDGPDYETFKQRFNLFLNTPGAGALAQAPGLAPMPIRVCELAPVLIYTRLAATRAFGPILSSASIEQHHALRIEFKKLRYTVEYFQEVLGRRSKAVIAELKLLQDHLGELNDAQVAAMLIREFIDRQEQAQAQLPIGERSNLEDVVGYMGWHHARRHRLMSDFGEVWEKHFLANSFRDDLASAVASL